MISTIDPSIILPLILSPDPECNLLGITYYLSLLSLPLVESIEDFISKYISPIEGTSPLEEFMLSDNPIGDITSQIYFKYRTISYTNGACVYDPTRSLILLNL